MILSDRRLGTALRAAFFAALVIVLVLTLIPAPPPSTGNGDKVEHFAAFYGLSLLGAAAWRSPRALLWLSLALCAFGGLIELLQGTAFIGRSRDVYDWLADNVGILLAIVPILVADWRRRARPQQA